MSQANKVPDTFLNMIFLYDIDLQKVYSTAKELAAKKGVTFNGTILWGLPTNPQTFAESASFTIHQSQINEVFEELVSELGIPKSAVRLALTPMPAFSPAPPPRSGTA